MKLALALSAFALCAAASSARARAPLHNPALLNIGLVCKWQTRCIKRQEQAMGRSLKYVRKYRPPAWKIQLCNRNASRRGTRVDWVGYHNCIRNETLRPPPSPARPRKRRR